LISLAHTTVHGVIEERAYKSILKYTFIFILFIKFVIEALEIRFDLWKKMMVKTKLKNKNKDEEFRDE
jgi:hypothetical protein